MNYRISRNRNQLYQAVVFNSVFLFLLLGCEKVEESDRREVGFEPAPLDVAMVPHEGDDLFDREIQQAQTRVDEGRFPVAALERLGWAYISKARASFDGGYYLLAEACADAIGDIDETADEALLLRGHIFNNLHRFREAEEIALELVERRGLAADYLLLGDALTEQGKLGDAIAVYQVGMDMKPDLQSYARVGWIRWLIGDLSGAIEATERAVKASSPLDPESRAWVMTRLADFLFLDGQNGKADLVLRAALRSQEEYAPALLLKGRMQMVQDDFSSGVKTLERAVARNPMLSYRWALAEAYRGAERMEEASALEESIEESGREIDPRTFSLYLATVGRKAELAVKLARDELAERQDIFTHDALAWALFAKGEIEEAREHMDVALSEYTDDARIYLHAAIIAEAAGKRQEALDWAESAKKFQHALLPSEREHLTNLGERLAEPPPESTTVADGVITKKKQTNL